MPRSNCIVLSEGCLLKAIVDEINRATPPSELSRTAFEIFAGRRARQVQRFMDKTSSLIVLIDLRAGTSPVIASTIMRVEKLAVGFHGKLVARDGLGVEPRGKHLAPPIS